MYYFAYGSNMCTPRLARRVPTVKPVGPAWLSGHCLRWNLIGGDGSAKCNVVLTEQPQDVVHGVLFELDATRLDQLHAAEGPAYEFLELEVGHEQGSVIAAIYRGWPELLETGAVPMDWYRDFVLAGAREHGLPADWVDWLASVQVQPDDNPQRAAKNRQILNEIPANIVS